jgi:hypothetical protein
MSNVFSPEGFKPFQNHGVKPILINLLEINEEIAGITQNHE